LLEQLNYEGKGGQDMQYMEKEEIVTKYMAEEHQMMKPLRQT
jgi:hypothetical protein